MELLRQLRVLKRRWRWLTVAAVMFGSLGYFSAALAANDAPIEVIVVRYAGRTTLIAKGGIEPAQRLPGTENLVVLAQRIAFGDVPKSVAKTLKRDEADVARRVRVSVRNDAQTLTIEAFEETADSARVLADTYASAFETYLRDEAASVYQDRVKKAQTTLDEAEARLRTVRADLAAARANGEIERARLLEQDESLYVGLRIRANSDLLAVRTAGVPVVSVEALEPAKAVEVPNGAYEIALFEGASGLNVKQVSANAKDSDRTAGGPLGSPVPDSPIARAAAGAGLGFVLGALAAIAFEKLDPRIRTKEDVERLFDLPVIAEIPALSRRERKKTDLTARLEPLSHTAESFRRLRSAIEFASHTRRADEAQAGTASSSRGEVILITSPGPAEGKTTSTANLASVAAEHEREVLIINCDFRRPRMQDFFPLTEAPQQVHDTNVPGVHLITHVLADELAVSPAEVVAAQRKVIERARSRFDVILLDTAPLLTTNDAADLLRTVDMVVLIVHAGKTTRDAVEQATELLARRRAPLIGIALVGARESSSTGYYYYEAEDGYLRRSRKDRARAATPAPADAAHERSHRDDANRGGRIWGTGDNEMPANPASAPAEATHRSPEPDRPVHEAPEEMVETGVGRTDSTRVVADARPPVAPPAQPRLASSDPHWPSAAPDGADEPHPIPPPMQGAPPSVHARYASLEVLRSTR